MAEAKSKNGEIQKLNKMFSHVAKRDYYATVSPEQCYKIVTDLPFIFQ